MNRRRREILNAFTPVLDLTMTRSKPRPVADVPGLSVRNSTADTAEIMIYGTIGGGGWWDQGGVTAADMAALLAEISSPNIAVRINSGGGDVFDGTAIHTLLSRHPATVTTYNDGLAASAASFIMMSGDRIVSARNAMTMIHDGSTSTFGNEADHLANAELLGKVSDNIADMYAMRAGGTAEEWRALMRTETWYTGQEAEDAGLVDELVSSDEQDDAATNHVRKLLTASRFRNAPVLPPAPDLPSEPVTDTDQPEEVDRYDPFAASMAFLAARL